MKKFLTLMIFVAAVLMAVPQAEARPRYSGHTYVSGRSSCGCPVYSHRYIVRYNHCGQPIYSVRRLPVKHRCRPAVHYRPQPNYRHRGQVRRYSEGVRFASSYERSYPSSRGRCR